MILEETFPDLAEAGTGLDARTAIEAPDQLLKVGEGQLACAFGVWTSAEAGPIPI